MTAILALENGSLDDVVRASPRACATPFSSLNLKPGEELTLRDLLYAALLRSSNDAAVSIAEHIAGTESEFVAMMNEKAKEIGAKDTHFVNPHGLHHPAHYSTTYDLALIARYAADIPEFNQIVATRYRGIERSMNKKDVLLKSTARLLWKFDGADGIKTGYTKQAGHCFVGSATRDGWRLISVVLKSKNSTDDTSALLNFGFKYWKQVSFARKGHVVASLPVSGGTVDRVDLVAADYLAKVARKSAEIKSRRDMNAKRAVAPIEKGEKLGTLTGYINGHPVGSVDLLAGSAVDRTFVAAVWTWTRSILVVSFVLFAGYLAYGTAVAKVARRRRDRVSARS